MHDKEGIIEEEFDLDKLAREKRKLGKNDLFFIVALVVLTSGASFGLGRLSVLTAPDPEIKFENALAKFEDTEPSGEVAGAVSTTETKTVTTPPPITAGGQYVGSKSSDKYHLPWCSGALRIKEENKVWFASKAEAEKAGYVPAGNCKGI